MRFFPIGSTNGLFLDSLSILEHVWNISNGWSLFYHVLSKEWPWQFSIIGNAQDPLFDVRHSRDNTNQFRIFHLSVIIPDLCQSNVHYFSLSFGHFSINFPQFSVSKKPSLLVWSPFLWCLFGWQFAVKKSQRALKNKLWNLRGEMRKTEKISKL